MTFFASPLEVLAATALLTETACCGRRIGAGTLETGLRCLLGAIGRIG
jgi:hypothetical protein